MVFRNNESGVEITVFPKTHGDQETITHWQRSTLIPGRHLPHEYGALYFRCQELLVKSSILEDGRDDSIVFVPLENGILFVSTTYTYTTMVLEWDTYVMDTPQCSPMVIYTLQLFIHPCVRRMYEQNTPAHRCL